MLERNANSGDILIHFAFQKIHHFLFDEKEKSMRSIMAIVLIAFGIQATFGQEKLVDNSAKIISNLNRIETLYFKCLSQKEKEEATQLLNETRKLAVGNSVSTGDSDKRYRQNVLSEDGFQVLLDSVKKEKFEESKTDIVMTIGKNGRITCAQLENIISLYKFDLYREGLIRKIIDNVIDPVNIDPVLKHIDNSITRENLKIWVQNR